MPRIGVVGAVGIGKSTLCQELATRFTDHALSLEPIPDTLQEFLDAKGTNEENYRRLIHDTNIVKALYNILEERQQPHVIIERPCAENYFIFSRRIMNSEMYHVYFELAKKTPLDIVVFLHALPDVITNRINQRARPGEELYTLAFAKEQQRLYHDWYRDIARWHNARKILSYECSIKTPQQIATQLEGDIRGYYV